MKLYPNINQSPLSNLSVSIDNTQSTSLLPFFYKDKLTLEVYLHDGEGSFPNAYSEAEIKVAFGDTANGHTILETYQLLPNETKATFTLNIDTAEIELITREKLSSTLKFEIQVTKGNITKTLSQFDSIIRNQFLNIDAVADVVPFAPGQVLAILAVIPSVPSEVSSNTTPTAPSNVVTATGETVPLAPSDVTSAYESVPENPSDLIAEIVTAPLAVDWVISQKGAEPVTEVLATVLTSTGPTEVTAIDLSTIAPRMARFSSADIGTIPLEPSELAVDVSPLKPQDIETARSPAEISDLIVYDYANRPAGWLGGQPSNIRSIELFKAGGEDGSGKPTEIYAVKSLSRTPNEPEQYFGKAITEVDAEQLTPSNPTSVTSYYNPFTVDQSIDPITPFTKVINVYDPNYGFYEESKYSGDALMNFLSYGRSTGGRYLEQVAGNNNYLAYANTGNMDDDEIIFIHASRNDEKLYYAGNIEGYHTTEWQNPTDADLRTNTFNTDFSAYKTFYNAKIASGKKHNVYILAHQPWNDYRFPSRDANLTFQKHLAKCVYHDADRLSDYGCYAKIIPYYWTWAVQSTFTNLNHYGWRNISEWQTSIMDYPTNTSHSSFALDSTSYSPSPPQKGYWEYDLSNASWLGLGIEWSWGLNANANRTTGSFRQEYSSDGTDAGYITGYGYVMSKEKMQVLPQLGHPNHYALLGIDKLWVRYKYVSSDPNHADVVGPWVESEGRMPTNPYQLISRSI